MEVQEIVALLPQTLAPGSYHWIVACPEAETYVAPETLEIRADGHFTYLRRQTNIRYGEIIQLLGYRWRTTGTDLRLTLLWQALQSPGLPPGEG